MSWIAFVIWFSTELWVPVLFGDSGYYLNDGSGISFFITIGIMLCVAISTVAIFIPILTSEFIAWIQRLRKK